MGAKIILTNVYIPFNVLQNQVWSNTVERDSAINIRIPKEIKKEAKLYSVIDNRSLSGFVVEAIKDRVNKLKQQKKNGF